MGKRFFKILNVVLVMLIVVTVISIVFKVMSFF